MNNNKRSVPARLRYAINSRRRISFGSTTFSFKIIEWRGQLGEEFVRIIRSRKDFLSSILSQMGLPTLVRVFVCDEMPNFVPTLVRSLEKTSIIQLELTWINFTTLNLLQRLKQNLLQRSSLFFFMNVLILHIPTKKQLTNFFQTSLSKRA